MPTVEDIRERQKAICKSLRVPYYDTDAEDRDFWKEKEQEERMTRYAEEEQERLYNLCDEILDNMLHEDFEMYINRTYDKIKKLREKYLEDIQKHVDSLTEKELDDLPF